ncbi:MAG: hypothetical protein ABH956_00970 [Candidatus Nealsonbacteria bacterium]
MILGHHKQRQFLKKLVELNKLPHAFLFSGEKQIGKKTLAIEFIKFLNCQSSKRPCNICRSCKDIEKKVDPDSIIIKPEQGKKEISISQIRNLIWKTSLFPYSASFKTAIIDQAHLMTKEAQNCFLKTLEEPKGKSALFLITEYPDFLLPTIISRIQKIRFFPVKKKELENYLFKQGVSQNRVEYLTSFCLGKPGMIIDFLADQEKIKNHQDFISDIEKISESDFGFRFQYVKNLLEKDVSIKDVLDTWLVYFRKMFFSSLEKGDDCSKIKKIILKIQSTNYLISTTNINPKLALELLLMEIK